MRLLAGLTELDLSSNNLARLPPALTAATALRRLLLARNERLAVTSADVEHTIQCLPSLQFLDVTWTQTAPDVLEQLRSSLPRLEEHLPQLERRPA